ncbi:MAG: glycosyltransferase family 2 protein, partial [Kiritimatiellota bacterium]|nr:glycosyltransferase family 2 protein [Kiritimatiellota bacterium]
MNAKPHYQKTKLFFLQIVPMLAIIACLLYIGVRMVLVILADYHWTDKLVAWMLVFAEAFLLFHGIGYLMHLLSVIRSRRSWNVSDEAPPLRATPAVAVVVAAYHEPLNVVEDTLICFYNMTYPNKRLYFLDDTRYNLPGSDPVQMKAYREAIDELCRRMGVNLFRRKWHDAKAGMLNDFLDFLADRPREGFEFHPFSGQDRTEKEKYLIVLDADSNPMPDFVEPLAAFMETDPKLAFVQTPQYYTNFETNRVALAAGLQQGVFYEYICEGKSVRGATFCCGTNVIFRREALMDVGGFDVASVTEDFETSLHFHQRGWRSRYFNKVSALGMGPE